jgi:hypothetical protein
MRVWTGFVRLQKRNSVGFLRHDDGSSGFIKYVEIVDELRDCWLLKEDCTPRRQLFDL